MKFPLTIERDRRRAGVFPNSPFACWGHRRRDAALAARHGDSVDRLRAIARHHLCVSHFPVCCFYALEEDALAGFADHVAIAIDHAGSFRPRSSVRKSCPPSSRAALTASCSPTAMAVFAVSIARWNN